MKINKMLLYTGTFVLRSRDGHPRELEYGAIEAPFRWRRVPATLLVTSLRSLDNEILLSYIKTLPIFGLLTPLWW